MPANYEYNIDHGVIEGCAWDVVTQGDLVGYFEEAASSSNDLSRAVEYLDLGEVAGLNICELGALQICAAYEKLRDRGIRGAVIYAPSDEIYEAAKTIVATFASVGGDLPQGYRLTRTPVAIGDVHAYLYGEENALEPRLVA